VEEEHEPWMPAMARHAATVPSRDTHSLKKNALQKHADPRSVHAGEHYSSSRTSAPAL